MEKLRKLTPLEIKNLRRGSNAKYPECLPEMYLHPKDKPVKLAENPHEIQLLRWNGFRVSSPYVPVPADYISDEQAQPLKDFPELSGQAHPNSQVTLDKFPTHPILDINQNSCNRFYEDQKDEASNSKHKKEKG